MMDQEVHSSDLMISLSPLRTIQSLGFHGSQLKLRWVAEDEQLYELEIPLLEACKLVGFLQDALRPEGRTRNDRSETLTRSATLKGQSTPLAPVHEFKGISFSEIVALQWEVDSEECYELRLPLQVALPFLDALEETLPLDRKPSENITLDFVKAVSINDLAVLWQVAYRADRYLKQLQDKDLYERVADIAANTMRMDDDRKLRPILFKDEDGNYKPDRDFDWLRLLTDTRTELRIRGQDFDQKTQPIARIVFAQRLDDETWCKRPDLVHHSLGARGSYVRPKKIFKFGEKQWIEWILEKGKIRVSPASEFKNSKFNPAVRDDEVRFSYFERGSLVGEFQVDDYYVFCASEVYDYRFYRDFADYDSCLVIHNAEEFCERIRRATELNLRAAVFGVVSAPVIYFDPFRVEKPESAQEIWFSKHFRHSYQHEFRFVWPPRSRLPLVPFDLDIGDIRDIAELIARDSS
jgi:hypothetical protein